jgi:hypothetical protein
MPRPYSCEGDRDLTTPGAEARTVGRRLPATCGGIFRRSERFVGLGAMILGVARGGYAVEVVYEGRERVWRIAFGRPDVHVQRRGERSG